MSYRVDSIVIICAKSYPGESTVWLSIMSPEVISLGEPMVEFCATEVGRLGDVSLFKRGWGGDTSNFAVAAARQGLEVAHICRLGGGRVWTKFP